MIKIIVFIIYLQPNYPKTELKKHLWVIFIHFHFLKSKLLKINFAPKIVFTLKKIQLLLYGGLGINDRLNTVEAYNHEADTWLKYPGMIERRYYHKSIAAKDVLFLVGRTITSTCEAFNSIKNFFCI